MKEEAREYFETRSSARTGSQCVHLDKPSNFVLQSGPRSSVSFVLVFAKSNAILAVALSVFGTTVESLAYHPLDLNDHVLVQVHRF